MYNSQQFHDVFETFYNFVHHWKSFQRGGKSIINHLGEVLEVKNKSSFLFLVNKGAAKIFEGFENLVNYW